MAHHEPFKALAPTDWSNIDLSNLASFLSTTFSSAQTLINSIPLPAAVTQAQRVGRARSSTDSALPQVEMNRVLSGKAPDNTSIQHAAALQKEWKEVKINPRENPLAINVYKLSAKDGRGAWFARRSIHEGLTYEKFKLGLEREFAEALKVQGAPGAGNVRGIGADRKVEHEIVEGAGKAEVYQLSAQFPGPTTPRDFVTLLLSTAGSGKQKTRSKLPRQFMVVSKPCVHSSCPQRSNFIRGQYESVEIIREIPIEKPLRRTRSSIDLSRDEAKPLREENENITREAILRSAQKVAEASEHKGRGSKRGISVSFDARSEVGVDDDAEKTETAIEWLMVTRSDPGGSVPRFMVEKGTPGGIVSDAGRLLKWLEAKNPRDFEESEDNDFKKEAVAAEEAHSKDKSTMAPDSATKNLVPDPEAGAAEAAPSGFYGMIAGALEAAGSVVTSKMFAGSGLATDSNPDLEDELGSDSDDKSSIHSFASAMESAPGHDQSSIDNATPDISSIYSTKSDESKALSKTATQHERDLQKLQERRRKVQEKIAKMQERALAKKSDDKDKDAQLVLKLKEKHEREIAKQEEKYQRELKKLEQKKIQEEKKAEERRKKQQQREEKANMALELERVKAERDVALKQIEVLKEQIGEMQSQNTMLVVKLGKNGLLTEADFKKGGAAAAQN